jgi:chemotaxis protein CheC
MSEVRTIVEPGLEILHQLFMAATNEASAAMSRWTSGRISLTLDEVKEVPLDGVSAGLGISDEILTTVILCLEGEHGGQLILTFDEEDGRKLAAMLLRRDFIPSQPWSDLEKSALCETGNILGCAYLNAITRLVGFELIPSPPYFVHDYGASVIQQAVAAQAETSDHILLGRTQFSSKGEELNWNVIFIPTLTMRQELERAMTMAG